MFDLAMSYVSIIIAKTAFLCLFHLRLAYGESVSFSVRICSFFTIIILSNLHSFYRKYLVNSRVKEQNKSAKGLRCHGNVLKTKD